ncbi:heavy metal-binding domain-containing protein [Streptomyces sp. NPDC005426]|uniref:heavy metal-binding domain-containing protein n=1 Tax=Streptomyces sp. NPDC005426 TaxID=3155344 RepID=UPI0033AB86D3
MGSAVFHIGPTGKYSGYHNCTYEWAGYNSYARRGGDVGAEPEVAVSGSGAPSAGLVEVFDKARRSALGRMTAECRALGGDGVVSAGLTMTPFIAQPNCLEFQVIGTAVRARGSDPDARPQRPFTSHLDGQGFAKLLGAGWVPVELLVGMSIAVRHDDYQSALQRESWRNVEMRGWSALVNEVRSDARKQLWQRAAQCGADGVVMADSELRIWKGSCNQARLNINNAEEWDHVAESTMVGTAITRFRTLRQPQETLSVLPLGSGGERLRERLAAMAPGSKGERRGYERPAQEIMERNN